MNIDRNDLINSIMESLEQIEFIKSEDLPEIELYMDQVTTFMDSRLRSTTRNPQEDKILTKTMINNYAKNDLLPSPEKKKYSKEHLLVLSLIYYLKGIMNFNDIDVLLKPITEKYFNKDKGFSLEDFYNELYEVELKQKDAAKQDILDKYEFAKEAFEDAPEKDRSYLKLFCFISLLGYDVYVKKLLIEKIIDAYRDDIEKMTEVSSKKAKEPKSKEPKDVKSKNKEKK